MTSSQMICPKCRNTLNKPPQLEILSEIKKEGGSFMAFGDPDSTLTCPACGFPLRIGDIIDGKHDPSAGGWGAVLGLVVVLGMVAWLFVKCSG